jgi:hypothetical protein
MERVKGEAKVDDQVVEVAVVGVEGAAEEAVEKVAARPTLGAGSHGPPCQTTSVNPSGQSDQIMPSDN